MNQKKFYVYAHFLLTGEVFYIGKGKGRRAYESGNRRNKHWKRKVAKHGGFNVVILQDNLTEELSFEVEKSFIESIGRENLVNMTDGGEGMSGHIPSEETRKKIKESNIGKKRSEETRKKNSDSQKGKKQSQETRAKQSESRRGNTNTLGYKHSEESRNKMMESHKGLFIGDRHPMFGKLGKDNPNSKKVNQYSKDGEFIKTWESAIDVERELKIQHGAISACCNAKRKSAGGYLWRFA